MNCCSVAQVANLPYRRLPIGGALERRTASGLATRDTADTAVCATTEAQHEAVPEAGAPFRAGSGSQCAVARTWRLSMNRAPSPHPSPPLGERVSEGRVRGIATGSWSQCAAAKSWGAPSPVTEGARLYFEGPTCFRVMGPERGS